MPQYLITSRFLNNFLSQHDAPIIQIFLIFMDLHVYPIHFIIFSALNLYITILPGGYLISDPQSCLVNSVPLCIYRQLTLPEYLDVCQVGLSPNPLY